MRKLFVILLLICMVFASCANETIIENDSSQTQSSSDKQEQSSSLTGNFYVANIDTLKYHNQYCSYIGDLEAENKVITDDFKMLVDRGYEPCRFCIARNSNEW
jgi:hypothetical protein